MTNFVQAFLAMNGEFSRAKGRTAALKRSVGSLRALAFPALMREMSAQKYLQHVARKRGSDGQPWDPFHFISHPGYLAQGLTLAQRFKAALVHYRQEGALFDEALVQQIYSRDGFTLWRAEVDGHAFSMHMALAGEESLEGDLCVRLLADGQCVGSQNFVWSDAALFGGSGGPTLFITRNQTHTWPELQIFRACFKQNSPPYFCLAALAGVAQACGMSELYAVHYQSQMSYLPKYDSSFRNSYDEFWEKFSARRVAPEAYRLALPLELRDLSELKSKHRSRAEARRRAWSEVGQAAGAAVSRHLRNGAAAVAPPELAAASPQAPAFCAAAFIAEGMTSSLPLVTPLA
jgi:uncharacterized protein VirK/YbjX